jgi:hypothetical protein
MDVSIALLHCVTTEVSTRLCACANLVPSYSVMTSAAKILKRVYLIERVWNPNLYMQARVGSECNAEGTYPNMME